MIVIATSYDVVPGQSVALFKGAEEDGSRIVTFGVDLRVADELVHEILLSGEVACEVAGWQVLSSAPAPCPYCGEPFDLDRPRAHARCAEIG